VNIALDTMRIMLTMRNMKWISWVLGFIETVLFVIAMGAVLDNLNNALYIIAYSAGFATGNVIGMDLENVWLWDMPRSAFSAAKKDRKLPVC